MNPEVKKSAESKKEIDIQITKRIDSKELQQNSLMLSLLPELKDFPKTVLEIICAYDADEINKLVLDKPILCTVPMQQFNHDHCVYSAVFNHDCTRILTASRDKTVRLRDLSGTQLARFNHDYEVCSAVFNNDCTLILTASSGTVRLWDLNGKELAQFNHDRLVRSAAFNNDCTLILTASGGTVRLWDLNGTQLARFNHDGDDNQVLSALFNNDCTRILIASYDKTARLWDLNGKELARFNHDSTVNSAVFNNDSTLILTASSDKTVRLLKITQDHKDDKIKLEELARVNHDDIVNCAAFNTAGTHIVTGSYDKTARLWDLSYITNPNFNEDQVILLLLLDQAKRQGANQVTLKELAEKSNLNAEQLNKALNSLNPQIRDHLIQTFGITDAQIAKNK
jgi:hypothetical protein